MNEKEISEALRSKKIYPQQAVETRTQLAGLYAFYSEQLEDILMRYPATWEEIKKGKNTNTETDRAYDSTPDGLNKVGLEMRLKRIEKMMSALKSIIDNANTERNHTK